MRSGLRVIRSLPTRPPPDSMTLVVLSGTSPQICFRVHSVKALRHAGSSKSPDTRPLRSGRRHHDIGEETGVLQGRRPDTVPGLSGATTACHRGGWAAHFIMIAPRARSGILLMLALGSLADTVPPGR